MGKILTIIKREYKESVFKRSFLILTLLMPVLMVSFGLVPALLVSVESEEPTILNIYDATHSLKKDISNQFSDTLKSGQPRFTLNFLSTNPDLDQQKGLIEDEIVTGLIVIPANIFTKGQVTFYAKNVADFDMNRRIRKGIEEIVVNHRLSSSGMDGELIKKMTAGIDLKTIKISKGGVESESDFGKEYFTTFAFVFILYMTLILYGTKIMRSVIQEKSSRIIEVLLSSVNPFQLMAGKILGQGSVGLTQYVIWALVGLGLIFFGATVMPVPPDAFNFNPMLFFYFVLFYLLGYFLFSTLYAGVGALVNTDQEGQQLAMPVTLMLIVPILLLSYLVKNPDSSLIIVFSQIPFFSPIIMFARINLSTPSLLEILSSVVILILSIIGLIWLTSKVFRVGILMYGKRPTLPEIVNMLKQ